jgi:hypothetical protein
MVCSVVAAVTRGSFMPEWIYREISKQGAKQVDNCEI